MCLFHKKKQWLNKVLARFHRYTMIVWSFPRMDVANDKTNKFKDAFLVTIDYGRYLTIVLANYGVRLIISG